MKLAYNEATSMACADSSLENDVRLCAETGFTLIELRYDKIDPYLETHGADDMKRLFSDSGVTPLTYNAIYIYPELFTENDDAERLREVRHRLELSAELAPHIGARDIIVVVPLHRLELEGPYTADKSVIKSSCVRILRQMSGFAGQHGLRLCLETVGNAGSAVRTVADTREIVEAVDSPYLGYALDSYNIFQYDKSNDFSALAALPKEKIFAVHINNADDVDTDRVSQSDRRFCDEGVIDLEAFLRALSSAGYDGMVSIETVRPEYWRMPSSWVIDKAYHTTRAVLLPYLT